VILSKRRETNRKEDTSLAVLNRYGGGVRFLVETCNGRRFLRDEQVNEGGSTSVAPRVPPTETIRAQIDELFAGGDAMGALEQIARLLVRLTFESVIEEVVL
jgi:hypothetical protein